jgi:hypothetical protein
VGCTLNYNPASLKGYSEKQGSIEYTRTCSIQAKVEWEKMHE